MGNFYITLFNFLVDSYLYSVIRDHEDINVFTSGFIEDDDSHDSAEDMVLE